MPARNPPFSNVSFDPSEYVRPPVLNIASAISLGQTLVKRCPADAPAAVKKAQKALAEAAQAALAAWTERQRSAAAAPALTAEQRRQLDITTDQGWGALRQNLESHALLPAGRSKKSARAQQLLQKLFPEGLSFLTWRYAEQLAAMTALLKRIDEDGLAKEIDAVAGSEFLANIRQNQADYRAMIQSQAAVATDVSLGDAVRAVGEAVVDYAIAVCATVERRNLESIRWAKDLLQPIDQLREQQRQGGGAEPAAPTPEPSPAPTPPPAP